MLSKKEAQIDVINCIDFSSEFIYNSEGLINDFESGRTIWEFEYFGKFAGVVVFDENVYDRLVVDIFFMYVENSLRRKGIGKLILEEVKHYLSSKQGGSIILEVRSDNEPALKLYKNFGFKENRLRRNYYNGKIDGLELIFDV